MTTAISGEEAFRLFEERHATDPFDLLFTDLVMPGGMDGMVLADRVAQADRDVGVLMTTGYNEELVTNDHQRMLADILGKPYRRSDLLDRVRQALNRRSAHGERRNRSEFGPAEA